MITISLGFKAFAADDGEQVEPKQVELIIGQEKSEYVDFPLPRDPKYVSITRDEVVQTKINPARREIIFVPKAPGETSVIIRNEIGEVRARFTVKVTSHNKSKTVKELKEYLGDIEGLEIGIKGEDVYIGGKIIVPDDLGRVFALLEKYKDVIFLVELAPQTQLMIAKKMQDEIQKNVVKSVTVRVVNGVYWLEGVVDSDGKRTRAEAIAAAYLPNGVQSLATRHNAVSTTGTKVVIQNFINVNEESKPQPVPKMIKVSVQFVELTKDYNKIFGFKWVPLLGGDGGSISIGKTTTGGVTTQSNNTLAATISNLFPRLASAKSAGFARVIQSGVVITKDKIKATIKKQSKIPFSIGTGEFTKPMEATAGFSVDVTPTILQEEKIDLSLGIGVASTVGNPPEEINNQISTALVVKSKESAVVGGIVINKTSNGFDRDPPFGTPKFDESQGNVPLFSFLKSKSYISTRSQFVFFVTPELIESASDGTEEIKKKFRQRRR